MLILGVDLSNHMLFLGVDDLMDMIFIGFSREKSQMIYLLTLILEHEITDIVIFRQKLLRFLQVVLGI